MSNAHPPAVRRARYLLGAVLVVAFGACAAAPAREPLQAFPQSELAIRSGAQTHHFKVWIADTAARRTQGLMFVKHLPPQAGMLFLFEEPQPVSMWMKNTLIPLDMLFVAADGRVIRIASRTEPQSLATISSLGLVTGVIELAGGESERLGIQSGDRVMHSAFNGASQ